MMSGGPRERRLGGIVRAPFKTTVIICLFKSRSLAVEGMNRSVYAKALTDFNRAEKSADSEFSDENREVSMNLR